jgi:hypothetical protein
MSDKSGLPPNVMEEAKAAVAGVKDQMAEARVAAEAKEIRKNCEEKVEWEDLGQLKVQETPRHRPKL